MGSWLAVVYTRLGLIYLLRRPQVSEILAACCYPLFLVVWHDTTLDLLHQFTNIQVLLVHIHGLVEDGQTTVMMVAALAEPV